MKAEAMNMEQPVISPAAVKPTHADWQAANAELQLKIRAAAEDSGMIERSASRRHKAIARLKISGLDGQELADEVAILDPVYTGDNAIHQDLHAHHYVIADIEKFLNIRQPDRRPNP